MEQVQEKEVVDPFDQRNREIGAILTAARQRTSRTVTECAAVAQTTRRRYSMIERGGAAIGVAELEALMRFLDIPAIVMWRDLSGGLPPKQVIVQAKPGEMVQFVVEVQG